MNLRRKVGAGGKVTVPAHIRKELNLKRGSKVGFFFEDGEIVMKRLPLPKSRNPKLTTNKTSQGE